MILVPEWDCSFKRLMTVLSIKKGWQHFHQAILKAMHGRIGRDQTCSSRSTLISLHSMVDAPAISTVQTVCRGQFVFNTMDFPPRFQHKYFTRTNKQSTISSSRPLSPLDRMGLKRILYGEPKIDSKKFS